jgi:hypothetical protein
MFRIFRVKHRQERGKRWQGCFYYASTDRVALANITSEQLFSLLKSSAYEGTSERAGEREREALSCSERRRETLTVLIINRAHVLRHILPSSGKEKNGQL